jgi:hypothetical protein
MFKFKRRKQDTPLDEAVGHEITQFATSIANKLTVQECYLQGIPVKNPDGLGYTPRAREIFIKHFNQTIDDTYSTVNEIQDIIKEMT